MTEKFKNQTTLLLCCDAGQLLNTHEAQFLAIDFKELKRSYDLLVTNGYAIKPSQKRMFTRRLSEEFLKRAKFDQWFFSFWPRRKNMALLVKWVLTRATFADLQEEDLNAACDVNVLVLD